MLVFVLICFSLVVEHEPQTRLIVSYLNDLQLYLQTSRRRKGILKNKPTVVKGKKVSRLE